ncbi:MAG: MerR family transcriptional regulator [Gemmatimonadota bacterium]|nr:MerR family transcriptional regulator [Gemmatimonadota bacterium]
MTATEPAPTNDLPRHPVRVVAQRSGLSTHVLRAWERRYGVVSPARSEGGQRLYSDADIERLTLLRQLTSHGGAIGQLAQLSRVELARLAQADQAERVGLDTAAGEGEAGRWRESALRAIEALDGAGLRRQMERGVVALGVHPFLDRVVAPVLTEVGQRWRAGSLGIAHEHLATAVFRQVLSWVRETTEAGTRGPTVVVATPPNQVHEGGSLLVAATAAAEGWRVVYLGVDLPVAEIAAAAQRTRAQAVALSLIHPTGDPTLGGQLAALRRALPADLPLLVGGAAAESYRAEIEAADGEIVAQLTDLRSALAALATAE